MLTKLRYGKLSNGKWLAHDKGMSFMIHANTLKELKERAKELHCVLAYRFDN